MHTIVHVALRALAVLMCAVPLTLLAIAVLLPTPNHVQTMHAANVRLPVTQDECITHPFAMWQQQQCFGILKDAATTTTAAATTTTATESALPSPPQQQQHADVTCITSPTDTTLNTVTVSIIDNEEREEEYNSDAHSLSSVPQCPQHTQTAPRTVEVDYATFIDRNYDAFRLYRSNSMVSLTLILLSCLTIVVTALTLFGAATPSWSACAALTVVQLLLLAYAFSVPWLVQHQRPNVKTAYINWYGTAGHLGLMYWMLINGLALCAANACVWIIFAL